MHRSVESVTAGCLMLMLAVCAALADPLPPGTTLCLQPIVLPVAEGAGAARRDDLQRRLRDALVAAGFAVADPQAVAALEERVGRETGGFIDPATGWRDAERYRAVQRARATALRDELHCDAVLRAQVVGVRARFSGGSASWDGTSDAVSSTGRVVLNALAGVHEYGWVQALSLWLLVSDLDGNDLAFRSAGIEPLVSMAVLRDQDLLPQDAWLTDGAKLDAAIRSALGPAGEGLRRLGVPPGGEVDAMPAPVPPRTASDPFESKRRLPPAFDSPRQADPP